MTVLTNCKLITVAALLGLGGCVGAPPAHIPLTEPTDELIGCDGLTTQYHHVVELSNERAKVAENTTVGNVFLLGSSLTVMPPAVLFVDQYEADAAEARAYRRRANALADRVETECSVALPRLEIGRDQYKEEADFAYARGEAAAPAPY